MPYGNIDVVKFGQVMACFFAAASHYLNQCKVSCNIHLRAISQVLTNLIHNMCSEINFWNDYHILQEPIS